MVMDDCNDGLPMYSVDVAMVENRRDVPSSGGYRNNEKYENHDLQ
jgi:hypothetical protein